MWQDARSCRFTSVFSQWTSVTRSARSCHPPSKSVHQLPCDHHKWLASRKSWSVEELEILPVGTTPRTSHRLRGEAKEEKAFGKLSWKWHWQYSRHVLSSSKKTDHQICFAGGALVRCSLTCKYEHKCLQDMVRKPEIVSPDCSFYSELYCIACPFVFQSPCALRAGRCHH